MKQFIKSICYFIPFLAITYILLLFAWKRYLPEKLKPNIKYIIGGYGHTYSRLSEVKNIKDVDILFIGSSHTYRAFDPRIFNENKLKTFNLGTSGQTPMQTKLLLNRYLDQLNPKLIIFEVYSKIFSLDGIESALDIIPNDRNDINSVKMAFNLNDIIVYNTLIYALYRDVVNSTYHELIIKKKDKYVTGGFVEKDLEFSKNEKHIQYECIINKKQLQEFNDIISLFKNKNRKYILVNTPIASSLYKSCTNNNTFDNLMNKYGKYYNFNNTLQLDDSLHFYDSDHLNQKGVEIFNKNLIKKLQLKPLLSDKK